MQIREHARANPDKPAAILHPSATVVTFGEMEARANQLAHGFRAAGLREGDVVAIAECRPLSRRKSWKLVSVVERAS